MAQVSSAQPVSAGAGKQKRNILEESVQDHKMTLPWRINVYSIQSTVFIDLVLLEKRGEDPFLLALVFHPKTVTNGGVCCAGAPPRRGTRSFLIGCRRLVY